MLTLVAVPKPIRGEVGVVQRNALRSWCALPEAQVILLGDEPGVADLAADLGVEQMSQVLRTELGTPRLDDVFAAADRLARHRLRCYVNADVVLLDDFLPAVRAVASRFEGFLAIGRTLDLEVDRDLELGRVDVRHELASTAERVGRSRGATAIDYFVFTPHLFDPVPAFAVGRAGFDNWLVWRARTRGPVIDLGDTVIAVHQHHDYAHVGGQDEAHFGAEARRNRSLAGGGSRMFTIHDASHRLTRDGRVRRNLGATLRVRERVRKARWKLTTR